MDTFIIKDLTQERLNDLAMIVLESDILEKIDYESIIENFISRNTKRMLLFTKRFNTRYDLMFPVAISYYTVFINFMLYFASQVSRPHFRHLYRAPVFVGTALPTKHTTGLPKAARKKPGPKKKMPSSTLVASASTPTTNSSTSVSIAAPNCGIEEDTHVANNVFDGMSARYDISDAFSFLAYMIYQS